MASWKKLLLIAAGAGGGFAIVLCGLVGGWLWYSNRPVKERDWNTGSIKATFTKVLLATSTPKPKMEFTYSLENTTALDYSLDRTSISLMATLPDNQGFLPDETLTLPDALYVPPKQKVVMTISKECEYTDSYPEKDKDDVAKIAPFMDRRLKEIDGFVIFDKTHRYKISLPNGWKDYKHERISE